MADVLGHTITAAAAEQAALVAAKQGKEALLAAAHSAAVAMLARKADVSADALRAELQPRAQLLAGSASAQVGGAGISPLARLPEPVTPCITDFIKSSSPSAETGVFGRRSPDKAPLCFESWFD